MGSLLLCHGIPLPRRSTSTVQAWLTPPLVWLSFKKWPLTWSGSPRIVDLCLRTHQVLSHFHGMDGQGQGASVFRVWRAPTCPLPITLPSRRAKGLSQAFLPRSLILFSWASP